MGVGGRKVGVGDSEEKREGKLWLGYKTKK